MSGGQQLDQSSPLKRWDMGPMTRGAVLIKKLTKQFPKLKFKFGISKYEDARQQSSNN